MSKPDCILSSIKLHGKDNPIYSVQLEQHYNLRGAEVRNIIRDLRRSGEPIANSKDGYYYARDINELKETLEDLRGRATSMLNTASLMEKRFNNNKELSLFKI
jgi:hypothetical protein